MGYFRLSPGREVRLYDRLFLHENPNEGDEVREHLNPDSLEVLEASRIEPSVGGAEPGSRFQFERQGYFCADPVDSRPDRLIFNRTVTLRDTWAKLTRKDDAATANVAARAAEKAAAKERQRALSLAEPDEAPALGSRQQVAADRYVERGVAPQDARILASHSDLRAFFDDALPSHGNAQALANWTVNELLRELKDRTIADLPFDGAALGELVALIDDGKITGKIGKEVFAEMLETGHAPSRIVESRGLEQLADASALEPVIDEVLAAQAENVALYKSGKTALIGFFVGQVMKATGGRANPKLVKDLLQDRLSA